MRHGDDGGSAGAGIPLWLPPALALFSCIAMGLTSFGDAIVFHCLWAAAGALRLYPAGSRTLSFAVLFIIIMPFATLPAMLWAARADVRRLFGWGTLCASSTVTMLPIGAALLLGGDVSSLKIAAGVFFLVFSVGSILAAAAPGQCAATASALRRGGWARFEHGDAPRGDGAAPATVSSEPDDAAVAAQEETTAAPISARASPPPPLTRGGAGDSSSQLLSTPAIAAPGAAPGGLSPGPTASATCGSGSCRGRVMAALPPIAPPPLSVRATALALWVTGFASGILGGLLGTSGPPYMVAYSLMRLDKDTIRGVTVATSVYVTVLKVIVLIVTPGSVARASDAPLYAAITVASWIGVAIGSALRPLVDSAAMLRLLYVLVFTTSGIMLGVLDDGRVAAAYGAGAALLLLLVTALRCRRRGAVMV